MPELRREPGLLVAGTADCWPSELECWSGFLLTNRWLTNEGPRLNLGIGLPGKETELLADILLRPPLL